MSKVLLHISNGLATVTLNRPEVHNAFDEESIAMLTEAFQHVEENQAVRALFIKGEGKNFCAGGDLAWMQRAANFTYEENMADAENLAHMLFSLYKLSKPTVALVKGSVFGGGVGLAAACDVVVAEKETKFCLSEVKLGLIPAVISPYVVRAMGARQMMRYAQTAETFTAEKAGAMGLVHEVVVGEESLNDTAKTLFENIISGAPNAMRLAKELVRAVSEVSVDEDTVGYTAEWIATRRESDEGKEGVKAFFEKRKPYWNE